MKLKPFLITLIMLTVCVSALFYFKQQQNKNSAQATMPEPVMAVTATTVQLQPFQKTTGLIGQGIAVQQAEIMNELAGKISYLNVGSGDLVKAGQVLFEINHNEEDALLKSAKAQTKLDQQTLERYLSLQKNGRISDEQVDLARAKLAQSQAEQERISTIIDKKVIKAPFDGHLGIHDLAIGQFIESNTPITRLIGNSDFIWVDFNVPQTYQELAIGANIKISSQAGKYVATATIVSKSPLLNSVSRQLKYRAKLPLAMMKLKPNQIVKVHFPVKPIENVVIVSSLAVKRDQLGNYVFALKKHDDGYRAEMVKVTLGPRVDDNIVIESGLEPGTLIASEGAFKLWPGVKTQFEQAVEQGL
ncbi:efflux RND transporter periplasmic adaptor subunit [Thalassotalea aquiviva]|uniref:efflux RND transporter periplasmic adaptor subunit n=1 Tax=Thalassotalea aquiviva TaxID=3242415 RepID=UPI00352A9D9A